MHNSLQSQTITTSTEPNSWQSMGKELYVWDTWAKSVFCSDDKIWLTTESITYQYSNGIYSWGMVEINTLVEVKEEN